MANGQDVMAGLLGGIQGALPGAIQTYEKRAERGRMSELAKLQEIANDRDVPDIEKLAELLPLLTAVDREKAVKDVKKRIGPESYPLLDYYIKQAGGAPPLTRETWRIGGEPAPERATTRLEQLLMGTQPGYLGELPEEERIAEWVRRARREEPAYQGITEVGREMLPKGKEEVLPLTEAARQRAREAGEFPGVTAVTEKWTPGIFPWEKEETIEAGLAKGTMTERQAAAARTFIDYTKVPDYAAVLTDEQLPVFGLSRDQQGRLVNALADPFKEPGKNLGQKTLRQIFSLDVKALPQWSAYNEAEQGRMRLAAFGVRMLSEGDQARLKTGKTTFGMDFVTVIEHPLKDYAGTDQYLSAIMSLIPFFDVGQIATILTLVENPEIAGGLDRLISLDQAQKR